MISQRFVSNNPQANLGVSGLARVPQQPRSIPRRSGLPVVVTDHAPWLAGAFFPSNTTTETLSVTDTRSTDNLPLKRCLYHPSYEQVIEYPFNPDRTINYYRSVVRKHDTQRTKTLTSNITMQIAQAFDDVVIEEIWNAGGKRLSVLAEFFDALHLMRMTAPALGRSMGWIPKDLGFQRHKIQPLGLTVGGREVDAKEARQRINTSMDSYLDKEIVFSFKLLRAMPLIDSLMIMEGR